MVPLILLSAAAASAAPADGVDYRVPPGFVATQYASVGGAGTSLSFGPDTREGMEGSRLYAADFVNGAIVVIDDVGGTGSPPQTFAEGFSSPLGVFGAPDGSVYVADSTTQNEPYGNRVYGRVWRVRDKDGDGVADKKYIVLKDLPNGRHNTNGMALGPDGMLYVANGNATDDGIEGGSPEVLPWSGAVIRVDPKARNVSITDLPRGKTLVATGMRNIYDVAFSPYDETKLFIPMNGLDDARPAEEEGDEEGRENSDDLLFLTDINDRRNGRLVRDDFGFPSCLYNVARQGNLKPYNNPHPDVIKKFGKCPKRTVPRPVASFGLHTSSDGLAFQTTKAWGPEYRNDVFVAEWGNLFGEEIRGHDVVQVGFDKTGTRVTEQNVFTNGPAPLDLTFDEDGNLYVLDFSGDIVKIFRQI